ncbi:MAG: helix-turn-helix transcriptional regulator [Candidatus Methylacidiphilales bacterium]|nr:helix-turn-helix transcriptional regulator [Candidatus Methylacidiphilales bacterium]
MGDRFVNAAGPKIRALRVKKGYASQQAFVLKLQLVGLDLDQQTLAAIELRQRSLKDYELKVIAQVLGVTMEQLFPEPREMKAHLPILQRGDKRGN